MVRHKETVRFHFHLFHEQLRDSSDLVLKYIREDITV